MQGAFDRRRPNGTHARPAAGRAAIHVYRLYRKLAPGQSTALPIPDSFGVIRRAVATARNAVRDLLPTDGRRLEIELRLPLVVEAFEKATEVRTAFTYTQGGYFLDTPLKNAKGITRFSIRGRTNWTPVRVNGVPVDGDAAIKEFTELIDDYFFPRDGKATADLELYFLDLGAAVSAEDPFGETEWLIHPIQRGVGQTRSAQRPFQRLWQFEFIGLESNRDRAKADDGFWQSTLSRGFLGKLLKELSLESVMSAVGEVFGTLDDARGLFDDLQNVVVGATDYVTGVTDIIRGGIGKVRAVQNGVQGLIGRILDGIDMVGNLPNLAAADVRRLARDFPGLRGSDTTPGIVALDELRRVEDFLHALNSQPQSFAAQATSSGTIATVAITPGTTLEDLAAEHGVDVDTLAAVNDLAYPFVESRPRPEIQRVAAEARFAAAIQARDAAAAAIDSAIAAGASPAEVASLEHQRNRAKADAAAATADIERWAGEPAAADRVLYAGDTIKIPVATRLVPSIVEATPEMDARASVLTGRGIDTEDRLFGFDLDLDSDGNLVWDPVARDLRLDRGVRHMANVQVRYVRLPVGALRHAPRLGNLALDTIGQFAGPGSARLMAYALFSTLQQDPRVNRVRNVTANTYAGVTHLTHDVELINGVSLPEIRVPVP